MSETIETEAAPSSEEAPKKPRKPRKPRASHKPKAEAAPEAPPEKPARAPRSKSMPNFVECAGKIITVSGKDVFVREMDAAARALHGIKEVQGTLGKPCIETLTLTFKSPKAAEKFMADSFATENEDEEMIVAGGRTEWRGDGLTDFLG